MLLHLPIVILATFRLFPFPTPSHSSTSRENVI